MRSGPERRRIKTLTQAALNADKTVGQVEDVLDGLGRTMNDLNSSLTALNATVARLEGGLDHVEGTRKVAGSIPAGTTRISAGHRISGI